MWRTVDYTGKERVWYEGELIERIKAIIRRMPYKAIDKIIEAIEENENEKRN